MNWNYPFIGWHCRDCDVSDHGVWLPAANSAVIWGTDDHITHDLIVKPCHELCPVIGAHPRDERVSDCDTCGQAGPFRLCAECHRRTAIIRREVVAERRRGWLPKED